MRISDWSSDVCSSDLRIGLLAKQKLQADVDEAHAAAERQPPCAARAAVHYREHGEGHGKNARNGHINAQHEGSSHRSTHHCPGRWWLSLDLEGIIPCLVTPDLIRGPAFSVV